MTRKETTAIALKCFAIYMLSQAFVSFPALATLGLKLKYMGGGNPSNIWVIIIPALGIISCATVAFLIWKFTNSLLMKETTDEGNATDIKIDGVVKIVFACMGVYFLIDAIIALPYALVNYRIASSSTPQSLAYLLTKLLELLFGGLLVAKPGQWVKAIRSVGKI